MKIRYIDIYIINNILCKYKKSLSHKTLLSSNLLSTLFLLNSGVRFNRISSLALNKKNSIYLYYVFKFSVFFLMLQMYSGSFLNKHRYLYMYIYSVEYFFYLKTFFNLYLELLHYNELIFIINNQSLQYMQLKYSIDFTKYIDLLNFLLKNRIRFVINLDSRVPTYYLNKLYDFDIFFVNFNSINKAQYLFINFLYYLKEVNKVFFLI